MHPKLHILEREIDIEVFTLKKVKVMLKVLRLEMSTAREGDLKCEEGWTPSHQTGVNK